MTQIKTAAQKALAESNLADAYRMMFVTGKRYLKLCEKLGLTPDPKIKNEIEQKAQKEGSNA